MRGKLRTKASYLRGADGKLMRREDRARKTSLWDANYPSLNSWRNELDDFGYWTARMHAIQMVFAERYSMNEGTFFYKTLLESFLQPLSFNPRLMNRPPVLDFPEVANPSDLDPF